MSATPDRPLSGYRVLDLSRILAGPYCTMMLADQGADVIKVERPGVGDDTRRWGPPFVEASEGEAISSYYLSCNRNKRSITIDLKSEAGRRLVRELAAQSDVVVHNFMPGQMEAFGLGYEVLAVLRPGLVFAAISAYGQDGPYADRPGYDMVLAAVGGMMHITGEQGGPPTKPGVALTDVLTGVHAAGAITAALLYRERTGLGQQLDLSLLDVEVASLANVASSYLTAGREATRWGTAHASIVPYQVFTASDRPIAVAAANERMWADLCAALEQPEWLADERFATNAARVEHRRVLLPKIAEVLLTRTSDEWMQRLVAAKVPCGPVNDMAHLFADPQVAHRGMVTTVDHPTLGELRLVASPVRSDVAQPDPAGSRRHPPLLGEHTEQILAEVLGYDAEAIAGLRSGSAI